MKIKDMLGEDFREGMTIEEIDQVLAKKEFIEKKVLAGYVSKDIADKYASEAANYKKQLRAKMSDDEAAKVKADEERESLLKELDQLRRQNTITEHEKSLIALGYAPDLATESAIAIADNDMAKFFKNQERHIDVVKKNVRAEMLKHTPVPPAAGGPMEDRKDYSAEIADARRTGDLAAEAYYTRLMGEAAMKNE